MIFGHVPEWYDYEEKESKLPVCDECGQEVDEYYWEIGDKIYCDDCAKDLFRRDTY